MSTALRELLAKATLGELSADTNCAHHRAVVRDGMTPVAEIWMTGLPENQRSAIAELFAMAVNALPSLLAKSAEYDALVARAYQEGWHECAEWAGRDDLHPDVDSKAYEVARDLRLKRISEE